MTGGAPAAVPVSTTQWLNTPSAPSRASSAWKGIQNPATALGDVEKQWVADLGLVLVSISPESGPEDAHSTQVEDAYAGLVWVSEHADEVGIDPSKMMVYGKSGGGGVAAATALMARERRAGPDPSDLDLSDDRRS